MIAIIDYQMGNLRSVKKAFERIGVEAIITKDPIELEKADKLILPGVGHFAKGMQNLIELNLIATLNELVINKQKPILGICLGMQLLTKHSEEGDVNGLGWVDAQTLRFPKFPKKDNLKIPHMGWNTVKIMNENSILSDVDKPTAFYFVHTYYVRCNQKSDVLTTSEYGLDFVSSINKNNIFGTQFHPEKSHDAGLKLLKKFTIYS